MGLICQPCCKHDDETTAEGKEQKQFQTFSRTNAPIKRGGKWLTDPGLGTSFVFARWVRGEGFNIMISVICVDVIV